jgi:hypothetical protein
MHAPPVVASPTVLATPDSRPPALLPTPADSPPPVAAAPATPAAGQTPSAPPALPPAPAPPSAPPERTWRDVTMDDVEVNLVFVGLPPDHGVVTPISVEYRRREDVECIREALSAWPPAADDDVVQRARNILLVAAVPDVLQRDLEHDVPHVVFDHLQKQIPKDQLVKVLYWIATHPSDGHLDALADIGTACLDLQPPDDEDQIRERIAVYGLKLLGRLIGKIK